MISLQTRRIFLNSGKVNNSLFSPQSKRTRNNFMMDGRMNQFIGTEDGGNETKEVRNDYQF
jgi:hypothetical protein